jgi:hypothetical protein
MWLGGAMENLQDAGATSFPVPSGANGLQYIIVDPAIDYVTMSQTIPYARLVSDVDTIEDWTLRVVTTTEPGAGYAASGPPTTFTTPAPTGAHLWLLWYGDVGDPTVDPYPTVPDPASLVLAALATDGTA